MLWVQVVAFMAARGKLPSPFPQSFGLMFNFTIGFRGWDKCVWKGRLDEESASLTLSLLSPDGDQGFPGDLLVSVTYALGQGILDLKLVKSISPESHQSYFSLFNLLLHRMTAMTTRTTVVNATNHTYFNLGDTETIADHWVELPSKRYTGFCMFAKNLPMNTRT